MISLYGFSNLNLHSFKDKVFGWLHIIKKNQIRQVMSNLGGSSNSVNTLITDSILSWLEIRTIRVKFKLWLFYNLIIIKYIKCELDI